ncbi:MAG TPA: hypothetical protein VHG32_10015, partial [Thermoanaerobaculia bacterium]|nr:hypothetical protein [Thermoanaerobaculia bacterium]
MARPRPPHRLRRLLNCSGLIASALLGAQAASALRGAAADPGVPREWLTPAEASGFEATPDYEATMAFLRRLAGRLPEMRLESFGRSAAG